MMINLRLSLVLAFVMVGGACVKRGSHEEARVLHSLNEAGWPETYTRAVAYRFDQPTGEPSSLLRDGKLDVIQLAKLKVLEVELTHETVGYLLDATFHSKTRFGLTACYNPHHIFVFYSNETPVAAIEICFSCDNVSTWPDKNTDFHYDLAALAKLSVSLGLGLGPSGRTLDQYLEHLKDRQRNNS